MKTYEERYELLVAKAKELPSGGLMGMMIPGTLEWALMKLAVVEDMINEEDEEVESYVKEWEDYFGVSNIESDSLNNLKEEQELIKFKSQWGDEYNIKFYKANYSNNGRLYIGCMCEDKEYGGFEPYCDVTVNLPQYTLAKGNYGFLDTNNGDPKLFAFMRENDWIVDMDEFGVSGFCTYPLVKFTDKFMEIVEEM